ncbi:methyltransferase domain-containing protein [Nostoc sp. FACHB-152]|uniref:class I SAM-dependent methyltransferase n=1 Tax=unclassified Nostoc TaxID=2593658 RepID=UPI0016824410|nr:MULTISPECIES: methyltransferase domain-containing protein [unclassified Nostoc]MBD2445834.1 methyltransferase domain-containing protein [Nostoc sp. FACHB-152]MBD2467991.1 methyltransferase domain-containing protein [Nostoc sp. FACHB-145]
MNNQINLDDYKQQIVNTYNDRSHKYDESEWHRKIAYCLVEYAQISDRQQVLDIATGTGHVALKVAQIVGDGHVVAVDISPAMLDQARRKAEKLSLSNLEFKLADAEALNFSNNSFDCILCANAFPLMTDRLAALRLWHKLLKPNGLIAIHVPGDRAFTVGIVLQNVLEKYDVKFSANESIGTVEKCADLLTNAGFVAIKISTQQYGNYITLEQAKQRWTINSSLTFPNPLSQLSPQQLAKAQAEYDTQLEALATEQGIWNDGTSLFAIARKPA